MTQVRWALTLNYSKKLELSKVHMLMKLIGAIDAGTDS